MSPTLDALKAPPPRHPPRVLHVVVAGELGGAERLLVDLARREEASRAVHEIAVFTPNHALVALFREAGLTVHDRGRVRENPASYLWRSFGPTDVRWLAQVIRDRGVDLVHTHTFGSHVLGTRAARRTDRPQLRTEHHVMHFDDASSSPFTRWAAKRTSRFVAVSEYVRRALAVRVPDCASRTVAVRNGVDTEYFAPRPPEARDGTRGDRLKLAIVCRLTAWKRVDLAIEAAARTDVDLVVIGDGEDRKKLEALAAACRARVDFVGYVRDPRPHVAACDATLSTSKEEPLGLSVLESLAMARPVIACATGGIPEIVDDGRTGFLAKTDTLDGVAGAIARAKEAHAAGTLGEMGERGRSFAVAEGSIEAMCRGYAAEYAALARST